MFTESKDHKINAIRVEFPAMRHSHGVRFEQDFHFRRINPTVSQSKRGENPFIEIHSIATYLKLFVFSCYSRGIQRKIFGKSFSVCPPFCSIFVPEVA